MSNCSNASLVMSRESSGVFQNEESKTCDVCDSECIGGCRNGTVSSCMITGKFKVMC